MRIDDLADATRQTESEDIKDAIEKGVIGAYRDSFELAEEFQKITPVYYDISKNFWIWSSKEDYYIRCDGTDILSNLHIKSGEEVWNSKLKSEILECIKITGRRREVKECAKTWIHTLSGIIDYTTGETIPAIPEYFLTSPIPHNIGTKDNIPIIDQLFTDWLGDRKQILYEWLAYNLVDDYPIHRMLILFGSGRNGKSQYTELLTRFVGKKNTTATELEKVIDSRFEASKLYRKKSALIGETNFTAIKSSARIKAICGGDMLTAEYKNKDPFDFVNTAKITISTNNIPESLDKTEAFYSRCIIEEFKKKFDEGKSVIDIIPESEYENLLFKCINLLPALMDMGKFTNEGTIEEKAIKYERISNPWEGFVEKELKDDTCTITPMWAIYNAYVDFCKKNNYRIASKNEVTQKLKSNGYEVKVVRNGDKTYRAAFGITTKQPYILEVINTNTDTDQNVTLVTNQSESENIENNNSNHNVTDVTDVTGGVNSFLRARNTYVRGCVTSVTSVTNPQNSQLDIIKYAHKMLMQAYGYRCMNLSSEEIDLEAANIKAVFDISHERARKYIDQVIKDIAAGH